MEELIADSIKIKTNIVTQDEKEHGERRKLNFGHTFGHAFEKSTGIPHGQAVSVGMVVAAGISVQKKLLSPSDFRRIILLLEKYQLPTTIKCESENILDCLHKDKKKSGSLLNCVLLAGIGEATIEQITLPEFENSINDLFSYCFD